MGRKSKLTPELIQDAVKLLKAGNYTTTVCKYLSIGETTWYRWIKEGKSAKYGLKREFWESIKKAEAEAEIRLITDLQRIADENRNWQAIAWMLERKYPERWGKKERLSLHVGHKNRLFKNNKIDISIDRNVEQIENKYDSVIEQIVNKKTRNQNERKK